LTFVTDWATVILEAAAHANQSEAHLRQAVTAARVDGCTWQYIGEALGISRQAAQQRFKDVE
jgi:hypothetical protein